ncbi:MAG: hypothetical protein UH077_02495 [Bacteroidales bacterium]|jgi:predicted Zn-dependent protease|nr:hypothetical protein [Bacteroidales bacterium]
MNYQDENEDIDYLINDFKNKVENKANLIFYDIDEWLDIIDFFSIENYQKYYLEKAIQLAYKQYPNNEEIIVRNADFIAESDYKKALVYLLAEKKILKNPEHRTLLAYQGAKILSKNNKNKEALNTAQECLKHKVNEYILNLIAYQYIRLFKYEEASKYLIKAFEICYNNYTKNRTEEVRSYGARDFLCAGTTISDGLISTTSLLCKVENKYKEIFYPIVEKFVEYDPQNLSYWEMIAEFYEKCEDYPKALSACEYYLCLQPNDLDMIRRKYLNYIDSGKKKDRIKILKKIIELLEIKLQNKTLLNQTRNDLLNTYGVTYKEIINIYFEENKIQQCEDICKEILKKSLQFPFFSQEILFTKSYIYHTLSRIYLELEKYNLAETYAAKIVEIEPENYSAKIAYSELLLIIGKFEQAEELFQSIYDSIEENIAELKSKKYPNELKLEEQYSLLTMLFTTWAKSFFVENSGDASLNLLNNLIEELLTADYVEDCLYTAFATYIEIITHTNTTTNNLEKYITEAIEMYGPTLLEDLIEFPPLEKNEELRLFLKELHKYFEDNEELY